jgi:hypothetical protein
MKEEHQKMTEELMKKNLEGKEQVIFMENAPYLIILVTYCAQKERSLWKAVKCITVYLHAIGIESRTTNILHLVYDDRLEVYSFNHDSLVNQSTKRIGIEYLPDEDPAYKNRSVSKVATAMDFPADMPLQSGDFNEFKLDESELPF